VDDVKYKTHPDFINFLNVKEVRLRIEEMRCVSRLLQQPVTLFFAFVFFMFFSAAIISLNSVNRLIFVTVKCGVFFAARPEFLTVI
jgi:hypothetical protein